MRIDKILAPVDFSPPARLALRQAIALARRCEARLTLLHVVESSRALAIAFPEEVQQLDREHLDESRRMLRALFRPEDRKGLDLTITVKSGNIEDEIVSTATEEGAGLVVMGTHGRGMLSRAVIGSVTQKLLTRLPMPIITVRQRTVPRAADRMLFATDLSEESKEALYAATELAQAMHASLGALHAVDVGIEDGAEAAVYLGETRLKEARAKLEEFKANAPQPSFDINVIQAETSVANTTIKAIKEQSASLVAVAISTNGPGSVAEALIRESPVPVLSILVSSFRREELPITTTAA